MTKLQHYYFPLSQPCRSVRFLLKAGHIPADETILIKGQHKTPEFLAINPQGLVPTIVDDGFVLSESAAILAYLADSRGLESWYPSDLKERAKVIFWLHWSHTGTRKSTDNFLHPVLAGKSVTEADVAVFGRVVQYMDDELDKNKANNEHHKFIADTSHPTIADLMLLPELDQLTADAFGLFDLSPYPNVVQYMADVRGALGSDYEVSFAPVKEAGAAFRARGAAK